MSKRKWSKQGWLIVAALLLTSAQFQLEMSWAAQGPPTSTTEGAVDARIDGWIKQLGDPSYIRRQNAKEQLERTGLLAFEKLRVATSDPNIEIASNAQFLLQSMRVVWALPNDSFEVQRLLKDYDEFQPSQKLDRMQRLAKLDRTDSALALLRFVRFESDENLSKIAALHLMDTAVNERGKPTAADWYSVIRDGLGDSQRTGAAWLRETLRSFDEGSTDLQPWKQFVQSERKLLESNSEKTSEQAVKRLYRWIAKWLAQQGRQAEAVAFIEPSLELLATSPATTLDDVVWLLEHDLPQAVLKLAQQKPDLFNRAQLRYLLAESHLKQGDESNAEHIAGLARDMLRMAPLARAEGKFDHEASQRVNLAEFLNLRGMYAWAEAELQRAEALHATPGQLSIESELAVRDELATFYWIGDEPQKAADVWHDILIRAGLPTDAAASVRDKSEPPKAADRELLSVMTDRAADSGQTFAQYVPSSYHFYLGLAALKRGDRQRARAELRAAVDVALQQPGLSSPINPDIVIAMSKAAVGDEGAFKQEAERIIDDSERGFRNELASLEGELAKATTRQKRVEIELAISSACNQLAWLLAGTGRKAREAIELSERSLLLSEGSPTYRPIYLDTLARCYFSAGQIDKAIELQTQAVSQMPYERQMQRQLAEFKREKEKQQEQAEDPEKVSKDSTDKR